MDAPLTSAATRTAADSCRAVLNVCWAVCTAAEAWCDDPSPSRSSPGFLALVEASQSLRKSQLEAEVALTSPLSELFAEARPLAYYYNPELTWGSAHLAVVDLSRKLLLDLCSWWRGYNAKVAEGDFDPRGMADALLRAVAGWRTVFWKVSGELQWEAAQALRLARLKEAELRNAEQLRGEQQQPPHQAGRGRRRFTPTIGLYSADCDATASLSGSAT